MKTYLHQSGPNGCRKNCRCCREEKEQTELKEAYQLAGKPAAHRKVTIKDTDTEEQCLEKLQAAIKPAHTPTPWTEEEIQERLDAYEIWGTNMKLTDGEKEQREDFRDDERRTQEHIEFSMKPKWEVGNDKAGCSVIFESATGYEIASHIDEANAAYIVKCVNAHEELLSALKDCEASNWIEADGRTTPIIRGDLRKVVEQAIARAEGRI